MLQDASSLHYLESQVATHYRAATINYKIQATPRHTSGKTSHILADEVQVISGFIYSDEC